MVALIAVLQFIWAAVLLGVVFSVWAFPDSHLDSRLEVKALTYVAAHHPLPSAIAIPVVMPLIAAFIAWTGFGLWRLKNWARNVLLALSGVSVALWLRAFAVNWWMSGSTHPLT